MEKARDRDERMGDDCEGTNCGRAVGVCLVWIALGGAEVEWRTAGLGKREEGVAVRGEARSDPWRRHCCILECN